MLTPYQKVIEKLKNLLTSMTFSARSTIEKERKKEGKNYFKTNALVPKKAVLRKEEGATVAATPYLLLSGPLFRCFVGPSGSKQRCLQTWETFIKYQKSPNYETPAFSDSN